MDASERCVGILVQSVSSVADMASMNRELSSGRTV